MLIRVQNLTKRYAHEDGPVDALRDLSLDVSEGAFLTITGRSGSGKSTLLLALGGLLKPTSGHVFFRDLALHAMADPDLADFRRRNVGFVMQSFNLIPYLTAVQNVMVPLALIGRPRQEQRDRATKILESVDLGPRRNHLPRELSIGQQQRVAIARAFANDPALILADEPTGNLDPSLAEDILDLLGKMNRERGTTVVMVTHSPEAARRGSVQVRLSAGQVVEAATSVGVASPA
jgi:putative ABC transport system ATP-binding protein